MFVVVDRRAPLCYWKIMFVGSERRVHRSKKNWPRSCVPRIVVFVLVFDNHARAATHNGHAVCLGLVATTKAEAYKEKLAMMMGAISNQCFC